MKKSIVILFSVLASSFFVQVLNKYIIVQEDKIENNLQEQNKRVDFDYGRIPVHFEPNVGQTDDETKFLARGLGYNLYLRENDAVLVLREPETVPINDESTPVRARNKRNNDLPENQNTSVRMQFVGANPNPQIIAMEELVGKSNYFIGNDPNRWHRNVPNFARIKYKDIYPGVDLLYYCNQRQLEFDFIVAPGVDPNRIKLDFEGSNKIKKDIQGGLILQTDLGDISIQKPTLYQKVNGMNNKISGDYIIEENNQVGFLVSEYDVNKPLTIDPVFIFSTYLGGVENDYGNAIAVDHYGDIYLTGATASLNSGMKVAFQDELYGVTGGIDALLVKLNKDGTKKLYSTYFGGSGIDEGIDIAVTYFGTVFITGTTMSRDDPNTPEYEGFPVVNAFQHEPHSDFREGFVVEFAYPNYDLVYSTYFGGDYEVVPDGIAINGGYAYIVGSMMPSIGGYNFVTRNAFQSETAGYYYHAFVAKFATQFAGDASLVYSTLLGGSNGDQYGRGITSDLLGYIYVTGRVESTDFPITDDAIQKNLKGDRDAFVTKLDTTGSKSKIIFSTYLGGDGLDSGLDIVSDDLWAVYVTGYSSQGFPTTPGVFQTTGPGTGFVTKFSLHTNKLLYSTYYLFSGNAIAVDGLESVYVIGTVNPPGSNVPDVGVAQLNAAGSDTIFTMQFGGSQADYPKDIAYKNTESGNIYITGFTISTDFPISDPIQPENAGNYDLFISMIGINPTSIENDNAWLIPDRYILSQNYPNPFNPITKIRYTIPAVGTSLMKFVQLKVYDVLGKEVATLVDEYREAGSYEVELAASTLASGVYYYRLQSGSYVETKKMILLR